MLKSGHVCGAGAVLAGVFPCCCVSPLCKQRGPTRPHGQEHSQRQREWGGNVQPRYSVALGKSFMNVLRGGGEETQAV